MPAGTTSINVPFSWTGNTPSTTTNPLQVPVFTIRGNIGTCLDTTGQTPWIGAPVTSQPCDIGGVNQASWSSPLQAPQQTPVTCAGYAMVFGCIGDYFSWVDSW